MQPYKQSASLLRLLAPAVRQALWNAGSGGCAPLAQHAAAPFSGAAAPQPSNAMALIKELREKSGAPISDVKVGVCRCVCFTSADADWQLTRPPCGKSRVQRPHLTTNQHNTPVRNTARSPASSPAAGSWTPPTTRCGKRASPPPPKRRRATPPTAWWASRWRPTTRPPPLSRSTARPISWGGRSCSAVWSARRRARRCSGRPAAAAAAAGRGSPGRSALRR
jgi:hypothetical protein